MTLNDLRDGAEPGNRYDVSSSGTPLTVTRPPVQHATWSPGRPITPLVYTGWLSVRPPAAGTARHVVAGQADHPLDVKGLVAVQPDVREHVIHDPHDGV